MSLRSTSTLSSNLILFIISDLRHITNRTRGEIIVKDPQTETWLVTEELSRNREPPPDIGDKSFHQQILGRLYNRFMRFVDKRLRGAVCIDEQHLDGGGVIWENSIATTLTAQDDSNPSKAMEAREGEHKQELAVSGRFAEIVAYLYVFASMRDDRCTVAIHLAIVVSTLHSKMKCVKQVIRLQPSLFDGITAIPSDFMSPYHSGRLPAMATTSEKHRPFAFLTQLELFVHAYTPIHQFQQCSLDDNSPQTMDSK